MPPSCLYQGKGAASVGRGAGEESVNLHQVLKPEQRAGRELNQNLIVQIPLGTPSRASQWTPEANLWHHQREANRCLNRRSFGKEKASSRACAPGLDSSHAGP